MNQRKFEYYKQILGLAFIRGMFGEFRLLSGKLRFKSPNWNSFKNQRDVRCHRKSLGNGHNWVTGKELQILSWPAMTSDPAFSMRCDGYLFLQTQSIPSLLSLAHSDLGQVWPKHWGVMGGLGPQWIVWDQSSSLCSVWDSWSGDWGDMEEL